MDIFSAQGGFAREGSEEIRAAEITVCTSAASSWRKCSIISDELARMD
jgi:hypothetical protein